MALDREDTLKKAEKLLRQGKLDAAIAEYVRVVEEQPRDWNTAQHARRPLRPRQPGRQGGRAVRAHRRSPLRTTASIPKAAALYKKILKITPDDEVGAAAPGRDLGQAGAARRRQVATSSPSPNAPARARRSRRRRRDRRPARHARSRRLRGARLAARTLLSRAATTIGAAMRYRELHADLLEKGRAAEALAALREAVRLNPDDVEGRAELARAARRGPAISTRPRRISIARPPARIRRC